MKKIATIIVSIISQASKQLHCTADDYFPGIFPFVPNAFTGHDGLTCISHEHFSANREWSENKWFLEG
ncbi:MAG: hypothetical protein KKE17_13615 [Proteobacteria bacterium]|nr:hypothetical protein [Pseudomonadota bacterium]MBU1711035.1 hypothetical protein [Pseudomonadota bacterium]